MTKKSQTLRISCSDIAAICGFNPFTNFYELLEKYLYQGLEALMIQDADNLGLEYIDIEDEVISVIEKLDKIDREKIKKIKEKVKNDENLNSSDKTKEILKEFDAIVTTTKVKKVLSESEKKLLIDEIQKSIRTGYGIKCENTVLDKYEKTTGYEVTERNDKYLMMGVKQDCEYLVSNEEYYYENDENDYNNTTVFSSLISKISESHQKNDIIDLTGSDSETEVIEFKRKKSNNDEKPLFFIIGKVDGISYQSDKSNNNNNNNDNNNNNIKVIVEIKNRVNKISNPPHLYDEIQLVSYMKLVDNCCHGDLVQSLTNNKNNNDNKININKNNNNNNNDFQISRVNLNGPPYYHGDNWNQVIIPKLKEFRQGIENMRMDDSIRYAYLLGTQNEKKNIIYQNIPYLKYANISL